MIGLFIPVCGLLVATLGPPICAKLLGAPRWKSYPLDGFPDDRPPIAGCAGARDLCPGNAHGPNRTGTPQVGVATDPDYQWCHIVREGDTARSLAKRVTGDASRAAELMAANPNKSTAMIIPPSGSRCLPHLDFDPPLCPREVLLFPKGHDADGGWNDHIDQLGYPMPGPRSADRSASDVGAQKAGG